tara:strand:- start:348 stop:1571 length:1224 start_codon:yes stop_codon:yes gene_type:complete
MGIVLGVNTVNENLVFGFDTNYGVADNDTSTRFYPGEPTTNEFYNTGSAGNILDHASGYGGYGTVQSGALDAFGTTNCNVYRNTGKIRLGPTGGQDIGTLTNGNTYTWSIYLKHVEGQPESTSMEFDIVDQASGGRSYSGTLGSNMTYQWKRFSVTSTHTNSSNYHFLDLGTYQGTNVFDWCMPQIDVGSHATPHTKTSRSNTASLIDLKKETNINVGSISFDSTGHPDFDGTDDFLVSSDSILVDGDQSWETVFMAEGAPDSPSGIITNHKFNSSPPSNMGINYVNQNGTYQVGASIGYTDGTREYHTKRANNTIVALNKAYHVVMTYDAGNNRLIWYVNGELDTTHNLSKTPAFSSIQMCSGRWDAAYPDYYFNGKIYVAKVYDKLLTDAEVLQNYKAYKNRFDI